MCIILGSELWCLTPFAGTLYPGCLDNFEDTWGLHRFYQNSALTHTKVVWNFYCCFQLFQFGIALIMKPFPNSQPFLLDYFQVVVLTCVVLCCGWPFWNTYEDFLAGWWYLEMAWLQSIYKSMCHKQLRPRYSDFPIFKGLNSAEAKQYTEHAWGIVG